MPLRYRSLLAPLLAGLAFLVGCDSKEPSPLSSPELAEAYWAYVADTTGRVYSFYLLFEDPDSDADTLYGSGDVSGNPYVPEIFSVEAVYDEPDVELLFTFSNNVFIWNTATFLGTLSSDGSTIEGDWHHPFFGPQRVTFFDDPCDRDYCPPPPG